MRRRSIIALLVSVGLLISSGSLMAPEVRSQPSPGLAASQEPLIYYFDNVLRAALQGRPPADEAVRQFYDTGLSDQTRARIDEDQFRAFWHHVAGRLSGTLLQGGLSYTLGTPLESESPDQVLIPVILSPRAVLLGFLPLALPVEAILGCVSVGDPNLSGSGKCLQELASAPWGDHAVRDAVYRVVREGDKWKLVLPESLVREILRVAPQSGRKRYTPSSMAAVGGLIVRVTEVDLRPEGSTVLLSIENAGTAAVSVVNALSLATLVDDRGVEHPARILRSRFPELVAARSTVTAGLTFEPVSLAVRRLVLSLPHIVIAGDEFTLRVDVELLPLPYAQTAPRPVPAEPVLVYLLTVLRLSYRVPAALEGVYRFHLSEESRRAVGEPEFVAYYATESADPWVCGLGAPDDFNVGPPAYNARRDQASLTVVTARRESGTPGAAPRTAILSLRVVKEGPVWKLALPEEVVQEIKRSRPQLTVRRYRPEYATASRGGVQVRVTEVVLDRYETEVRVTLWNLSGQTIQLIDVQSNTTLEDEFGPPNRLRWSTLPGTLLPGPTVGVLVFWPVRPESSRIVLTLGDFGSKGARVRLSLSLVRRLLCR